MQSNICRTFIQLFSKGRQNCMVYMHVPIQPNQLNRSTFNSVHWTTAHSLYSNHEEQLLVLTSTASALWTGHLINVSTPISCTFLQFCEDVLYLTYYITSWSQTRNRIEAGGWVSLANMWPAAHIVWILVGWLMPLLLFPFRLLTIPLLITKLCHFA